jgi:peptidyl-prolyl cis-trans isomerase-like protein 2
MLNGASTPIETDRQHDPLKGINVDAAGGASKVLKMISEKSKAVERAKASGEGEDQQEPEEGTIAIRPKAQKACEILPRSTNPSYFTY